MNIAIVAMQDVDRAWGLIGSKVTDCLKDQKADITAADLWMQCRTASAFVVLITDDEGFRGAIVWRFETWPDGLVMRAIVAVGDNVEALIQEIYDWCAAFAKSMGATRIAILGTRPAWGRMIKRKAQITYNYIFEVPDE